MADGWGLEFWGVGPWGSVELGSSISSGGNLGPFEFQVVALSKGYSIKITFTAPDAADAPLWSRRLRILRKQGEWPQSWDDSDTSLVLDNSYLASGGHQVIEEDLVAGQTYYYALYTLATDGTWIHDSEEYRGSAYPYDRWGGSEYLFKSLPRGWQSDDVASGHLQGFVSIFGALSDNLKTDIEHLSTLFEINSIHDDLIYLLDRRIGWPTWLAAGGLQRRKETSEAVDIYKLLGRTVAYERLLEGVSDWDAEIVKGWRYVFFSNGLYGSTTPDLSTQDLIDEIERERGSVDDVLKYTNHSTNWHSMSGLSFVLSEIEGVSGSLTSTMLSRFLELIEWGKASYVNSNLVAIPISSDSVSVPLEEWEDIRTYSDVVLTPLDESLIATTADVSLFLSTDAASTTNTLDDRVFHSALEYV